MKKSWIIVILIGVFVTVILIGGVIHIIQNPAEKHVSTMQSFTFKSVEPLGEVPDEFRNIVENNLFYRASAHGEKLIKIESTPLDDSGHNQRCLIQTMDKHGASLLEYETTSDRNHRIDTYIPTLDDGILFVLGFQDSAVEDAWASDSGFVSRIIKTDKDGNVQFDTSFDQLEGSAFKYCFETNDHFYFFGEYQTPETKKKGVYSPSDIIMHILDKQGNCLKSSVISGSGFDHIVFVKMIDDHFTLFIHSQSDDGDFEGSNSNGYLKHWTFTVNDSLETTEKCLSNDSMYSNQLIGIKDGTNIYRENPLFSAFDAGSPSALIDYGDFYLIVSENKTGVYENKPPLISAVLYYSETVYSTYNDSGELLFRAAVDSSPDYDAMFKEFNDF